MSCLRHLPARFFCCFVVLLVSLRAVRAQESDNPAVIHTFVFKADRKLKSVAVAGTFNGWNKSANLLAADADGRTWRLPLSLYYGKYLYKFILDDEQWIVDPQAARNEDDGSGHANSVLLLAPSEYDVPANPNDGKTATSVLLHRPQTPYLNYDRGKLIFSLRARAGDLRGLKLLLGGHAYPLSLVKSDDLYAVYQGEIQWDKRRDMTYDFELEDGARKFVYSANGLNVPVRPFRIIAAAFKPYAVPDWVERTAFYQIFPDRFDNGDKANDPPNVAPWDAAPTGQNRFGGDVAGVRRHLPYLKDLGISTVYFNPVFQSPSNHRYDAESYEKIDPQFGTNAEFSALTKEMQHEGIRTVMDFVFNHTATTFAPFLDIRQKGEASPFKDWYFIKSFPVRVERNPNYVAWNNYQAMPKLNLMNPPTGDAMLNLVNFWKQQVPLAGLRLDVASEVDMRFWRRLRQRAKSLDPQMWIVGEMWGDGSPWLEGDQWDSVMNYQFREACFEFFAQGKTSPSQFTRRLMEIHKSYLPQVSRNMMNLLSSHDTPRFLTLCNNDANLHKLAAAVQFTWVGAPSIYYGEEIGMQGGPDPDCRRGMRWDTATPDNEMLRYYKRLIQIRQGSRALQSGDPSILLADDKTETLTYARTLGSDVAVVVLNRSQSPHLVEIPMPANLNGTKMRLGRFTNALTGAVVRTGNDGKLKIEMAPLTAAILLPASGSQENQ